MAKFLIMGPITRDVVLKDDSTCRGIGGPIYYQANVLSALKMDVTAVITLGKDDVHLLKYFPPSVELLPIWGEKTMQFENIYPDENLNHRVQKACIPVSPIEVSHLSSLDLDDFDALLVSPLSPHDVPFETLKYLSQKDIPIYLGAQGYLRHLEGHEVVLKPWKNYEKFLKYVNFLFMDEVEAGVIMGDFDLSFEEISRNLSILGPEEIIITRGDRGSRVYSRKKNITYKIPAFPSKEKVDPTGLGDTYLAAYAFRRQELTDPYECGIFASLVSSLKLENKGAFQGNRQHIEYKRSKYVSLINRP